MKSTTASLQDTTRNESEEISRPTTVISSFFPLSLKQTHYSNSPTSRSSKITVHGSWRVSILIGFLPSPLLWTGKGNLTGELNRWDIIGVFLGRLWRTVVWSTWGCFIQKDIGRHCQIVLFFDYSDTNEHIDNRFIQLLYKTKGEWLEKCDHSHHQNHANCVYCFFSHYSMTR